MPANFIQNNSEYGIESFCQDKGDTALALFAKAFLKRRIVDKEIHYTVLA